MRARLRLDRNRWGQSRKGATVTLRDPRFSNPAVQYEEQLRQSIKWAEAGRRRAVMPPWSSLESGSESLHNQTWALISRLVTKEQKQFSPTLPACSFWCCHLFLREWNFSTGFTGAPRTIPTRFSLRNGTPAASPPPTPTGALLIHCLVDWEASLAIWENNVISGWAELLNPVRDYSPHPVCLSDYWSQAKRKEMKVSTPLPTCFHSRLALSAELLWMTSKNWHPLLPFLILLSQRAPVWSRLRFGRTAAAICERCPR